MLDFRIETFLMLCETMNYTKTAENLSVTQPAVTHHIKHLEDKYGCKLFSYSKKTLALTEKGKMLENYAKSMVINSRKIEEDMKKPLESQVCFKIGATKTIGEFIISRKITRFLKHNTDKNVALTVDNTQRLLTMLEHGSLDFVVLEGYFDKSKYNYKLYKTEEFIGVCSSKSPFAGKEINIEDLFGQRIYIREDGSGTRAVFEQMLHEKNYSLKNFKSMTEISNFAVIKNLVKETHGVTFLYNAAAKQELDLGEIVKLNIKGMNIKHEFNYVFLQDNLFGEKYSEFFEA